MARLIIISSIYIFLCFLVLEYDYFLVWAVAWSIQSVILVGLLSVVHECSHKIFISKYSALNHALGRALSMFIGMNYTLYRVEHALHHRHLNGEGDSEPEVQINTLGAYLRYLLINPHFVFMTWTSAKAAFGHLPFSAKKPSDQRRLVRDARLVLAWFVLVGGSAAFFSSANVLWLYLVPLAMSIVLDAFFSLPEHHGLRGGESAVDGTRTIQTNALARFFLWNVNYHTEHHLQPNIRYDGLREAFEGRRSNFKGHLAQGYLPYHGALVRNLFA